MNGHLFIIVLLKDHPHAGLGQDGLQLEHMVDVPFWKVSSISCLAGPLSNTQVDCEQHKM
jgi:hypothetical protein